MGNAMINIIFNLVTSVLFIPFIKPFAKLIQHIISEQEQVYPLEILKYPLHKEERRYDEDMANISLKALQDDKNYLVGQVLEYISSIWDIDINRIQHNDMTEEILDHRTKFNNEEHRELYEEIIDQLDTIFAYMHLLSSVQLEYDDRQELIVLQKQFISLSNACKATENIREYIDIMRGSTDKALARIHDELLHHIVEINKAVSSLITNNNTTKNDNLAHLVQEMTSYHDSILSHVSPFMKDGNIGEMDLSSLINLTRELSDGYKDIMKTIT